MGLADLGVGDRRQGHKRDRLDLDELIRVTEQFDAEQCARWSGSAEPLLDDLPDAHKLGAVVCDHIDRGLQDLLEA